MVNLCSWDPVASFVKPQCTTTTSGLLPYIHDLVILWSSIASYIYHFPLLPLACACITFLQVLSHIFYIFPNGSSLQINHVVFYICFGLTCCIHLTHDLNSLKLLHTFYIYCFLGSFEFLLLCYIGSNSLFLCSHYQGFSYPF